jgi:hypothetical protein
VRNNSTWRFFMSRMLSFVEHLSKLGRDLDHLIDSAHYHAQRRQKNKALVLYRQAAESGGGNPDIVGRVAHGLRELGEMDEAGEVVRLAMFRHPHDRRFRQLWDRHRFQQLWSRQNKRPSVSA